MFLQGHGMVDLAKTLIDVGAVAEKSEVLFYKAQGQSDAFSGLRQKDFMILIMTKSQTDFVTSQLLRTSAGLKECMDSTHGIGSHGFELTKIMAVSDLNEGFPIAFCISSVVDNILTFLRVLGHPENVETLGQFATYFNATYAKRYHLWA